MKNSTISEIMEPMEGSDAGSLVARVIHRVFGIEIGRITFDERRFGTVVCGPEPGDLFFPAAYGGKGA
ncbi:hypothetical protein DE4585_04922 [Mycobacteroides salmoniphilum]|uniref:Uncharacterized protein n=1 Tax=Mycobacteroides salmoniphilum TaxID=404941 RepID=A0A4R8RUY5_9MYCO|nr:hypothetical protein DE4585_04922 [Mycobacteroides salmoniphilum]